MPRYQKPGPMDAVQQKINRAMVDGVGGLRFVAQAPPGVGRLVRIPFYAETGVAGYNALTGQAVTAITGTSATASTAYPVINALLPTAAGQNAEITLKTPQISWALLRIVGFEVNQLVAPSPLRASAEVCFSDLKIGGGGTLFVHEDYAPAGIYLMGQESFAGLRDYPLLSSPNQAEVKVRVVGNTGVAASLTILSNSPNGDVIYTAFKPGEWGESITVAHVQAGATSVVVTGTAIVVNADFALGITAAAVVTAVLGNAAAAALVTPSAGGTGLANSTAAVAAPLAGGLGDHPNFSCNLVCEIVQDDNYGSHVPGPYARPGALVRQG